MDKQQITFHYFGLNGRGCVTRAILAYKNIKYEDKRYSFEEFGKVKQDFDYGYMPELIVDGTKMTQTHAINYYLAGRTDLLGKTPEQGQACLSLMVSFEDWIKHLVPLFFPKEGQNQAEVEKTAEDALVRFFGVYEALYKRHGSGKYFLGDVLSVADIFLSCACYQLAFTDKWDSKLGAAMRKAAPGVTGIAKSVHDNELKEFFEKVWVKDAFI